MVKDTIERYTALVQLLALPDPPELPHRGYHYTTARDPRKVADILKRDLGTAYVERRRHELGRDISAVVSVHKHSTLRMVKRA